MCNFKSAIWLKDRLVWSIKTDSHEGIISEFKIHESAVKTNIVRVEFSPDCNIIESYQNEKAFSLKIDQDIAPEWFDAESRDKCLSACKSMIAEVFDKQFIIKNDVKEISHLVYVLSGGTVQDVYNGGTVKNVNNGGTVVNVYRTGRYTKDGILYTSKECTVKIHENTGE